MSLERVLFRITGDSVVVVVVVRACIIDEGGRVHGITIRRCVRGCRYFGLEFSDQSFDVTHHFFSFLLDLGTHVDQFVATHHDLQCLLVQDFVGALVAG